MKAVAGVSFCCPIFDSRMDKPLTFLVIDDSYIDRLVSAMMVRHTFDGMQVFEMSGGHQALTWLQAEQKTVHHLVILLDIMMPQMNGFEFLVHFDKIRPTLSDGSTVVMLSSTLDDDDIRQAKNHPYVKKFLSKPLSPNQLKSFIDEEF
jgi:response regulator RpfG family c-di-GMP phosphodiesterase